MTLKDFLECCDCDEMLHVFVKDRTKEIAHGHCSDVKPELTTRYYGYHVINFYSWSDEEPETYIEVFIK